MDDNIVQNNDDEEQKKWKEYCKTESDEAYITINKNQEEYDKQLLTLSTGLIAVLIGFIKDIVHLDVAIYRPLLNVSFAAFGLCIFFVLLSFQVSISALEKVRFYHQQQYAGNTGAVFPEEAGKWVKYINWLGGLAFVFGIAFSVLFITLNLTKNQKGDHRSGNNEDSRRLNCEDADRPCPRAPGFDYQSTRPACPEGEYCHFNSSEVFEIGGNMAKSKSESQTAL